MGRGGLGKATGLASFFLSRTDNYLEAARGGGGVMGSSLHGTKIHPLSPIVFTRAL